jgi:hypothetical protein
LAGTGSSPAKAAVVRRSRPDSSALSSLRFGRFGYFVINKFGSNTKKSTRILKWGKIGIFGRPKNQMYKINCIITYKDEAENNIQYSVPMRRDLPNFS